MTSDEEQFHFDVMNILTEMSPDYYACRTIIKYIYIIAISRDRVYALA